MDKRILLIAYHFPPSSAVGSHRIAGFTRYLGHFGWRPHVLTIRECHIDKKDPETLNGFKDVPIYRTRIMPDVFDAYMKLKMIYHSVKSRRKVTQNELEEIFAFTKPVNNDLNARQIGLKHHMLSHLVTMPDKERGWILPAVYRAAKTIRDNRYRCILTSSPPYSVHLIGYILRILFDIAWVADFRDPWMTPLTKKHFPTTPLTNTAESKIEHKVIEKADLVIANTEPLKDQLVSKYWKMPENKFAYLSNGYDAAAFQGRSKIDKYEKFTLCYTGTFYLERSPEPILKALQKIRERGEYDIGKVRLLLVGNCSLMNGMRTSDLISSYNLDSVVKVIGSIPHKQALEIISKSHLALLLAPNQPFQIPGKIFEYIGAGTKILAIAGEGATADLINKNGFGKVFSPNDFSGIKNFILQTISECDKIGIQNINDSAEKFNWIYIVEKLAKHLNALI